MRLPIRDHRPSAVVVLALLASGLVGLALPALASPEEQRLEEARDRLGEVRDELDAAREEAEAEAEALAVAEARLDEVLSSVAEAEQAVERQQLAVDEAEGELARLEAEVEQHKDATRSRVAVLYKRGGDGGLSTLLTGESTSDVLGRGALLEAVNRNDRQAFETVASSERAVDAQAEHLAEERDALERVLAQQQELLAEVEELREDQAIAAAEAEAEVEDLEEHEAYLEEESRELASAARRAARSDRTSRSNSNGSGEAQTTASSGSGGGGGWQWPAQGRVTSGYGTRWGRLHAGIDIANSTGTSVVAARGGTVSQTRTMSGYGNIVLINHGGGIVTAYAHLNSIEVSSGQQVSAGQRIGGMGCTGSCTGTHVHFEVRVNGNAQNPRGYLP